MWHRRGHWHPALDPQGVRPVRARRRMFSQGERWIYPLWKHSSSHMTDFKGRAAADLWVCLHVVMLFISWEVRLGCICLLAVSPDVQHSLFQESSFSSSCSSWTDLINIHLCDACVCLPNYWNCKPIQILVHPSDIPVRVRSVVG